MLSLGSLTFLSPWLLGALITVPALWWILRVMPPQPRNIKFPGFFLMKDLKTEMRTPVHTPWWLLLLRSLIVAFFIFALADPVMKISTSLTGSGGPVLVVVDNGWASAAHWEDRRGKLREILSQARRSERPVIFLPTAPAESDGLLHVFGPMEAGDAEQWADHLKPQAWPTAHKDATALAMKIFEGHKVSHTVFLSDGLTQAQDEGREFVTRLQGSSGLTLVTDDKVNTPYIMRQKAMKPGKLSFSVEKLRPSAAPETQVLAAYTQDGNILDTMKFDFPAGETTTDITWEVLNEMRAKVSRIALQRVPMASSTYLTDSQWQQHPVGVVADPSRAHHYSYLNEVYYLKRALEIGGVLTIDNVAPLLQKSLSAIIWPDSAAMTAMSRNKLYDWVNEGGFLIRFAGPNLAAQPDDRLLPVRLRYGERAMEGAMTWEKPVGLNPVTAEDSPFNGIDVPKDVTVTRQVLAEPTPDTFEKTWLQLEDGTPLVTGANIGKGVLVLIHTTAGTDWSNFCLSGLYVGALQRMIALSTGISGYKADKMLSPFMVLDGRGKLNPVNKTSIVAAVDPKADFTPSPATPPGLYGGLRQFQVFNLGDALPPMIPLEGVPARVTTETYALSGEKELKPDFFQWALWLLLADLFATLWLRGAFGRSSASGAAAAVVICLLMLPSTASAQYQGSHVDLASNIYLAYVETGDVSVDRTSYNGLMGLMDVVNKRTSVQIKGVHGVDLNAGNLFFYPFLYWPMTTVQAPLSEAALQNVQAYLSRGGLILFDTRDQQFASPSGEIKGATIGVKKLRELTAGLNIPELTEVKRGSILTKAFYLLSDFPGVYAGGNLWTEKEPNPNNDSVTSVLIGGNEWAAAWSQSRDDRLRYTVTPGGENQREYAYRFGVNMIMMALCGNYKSDQVFVPYILDRLRRQ